MCSEEVLGEPGLTDVECSSSCISGDLIAYKDRWFSKISGLVELHDFVFVLLQDVLVKGQQEKIIDPEEDPDEGFCSWPREQEEALVNINFSEANGCHILLDFEIPLP